MHRTERPVHRAGFPAHHQGHLLVGDLEGGLGVMDPGGAFHPLTVSEERSPLGNPVEVYEVGGFEGDTPERAMRAFAERG